MTATTPQPVRAKATRRAPRARAPGKDRSVADLVRDAVEKGATTVEEIHKSIAALPLDVLERVDGFEALDDVRKMQSQSIGAVYDVIRKVNREVAKLADELLATAKTKTKTKPKPKAAKPARATRRA